MGEMTYGNVLRSTFMVEHRHFSWNQKQYFKISLETKFDNKSGFFIESDKQNPPKIHNSTEKFQFAPEEKTINLKSL